MPLTYKDITELMFIGALNNMWYDQHGLPEYFNIKFITLYATTTRDITPIHLRATTTKTTT